MTEPMERTDLVAPPPRISVYAAGERELDTNPDIWTADKLREYLWGPDGCDRAIWVWCFQCEERGAQELEPPTPRAVRRSRHAFGGIEVVNDRGELRGVIEPQERFVLMIVPVLPGGVGAVADDE